MGLFPARRTAAHQTSDQSVNNVSEVAKQVVPSFKPLIMEVGKEHSLSRRIARFLGENSRVS